MYLTNDRDEAVKYAEESVHSDEEQMIVIEFRMTDLASLPVEFEPDWGWVDALENDLKNQGKKLEQLPTWQESLAAVGSFCLAGFTDAFKSHGKVTSAYS